MGFNLAYWYVGQHIQGTYTCQVVVRRDAKGTMSVCDNENLY
jgi:hypothetical protein